MDIVDEDSLKVYLGRKEKSYLFEVYPEVNIVARKIQLSPDIDLLKIDSSHNDVTAYETKYIKYHKGWKRFTYDLIYQGLGQALLYLNYGLEKIYLVVAYETSIAPKEAIERLLRKFEDVRRSLISTRLASFIGLRTLELKNGIDTKDRVLSQIKKETFLELTKLPTTVLGTLDYIKNSFFSKQFNWNKTLHRKIYS